VIEFPGWGNLKSDGSNFINGDIKVLSLFIKVISGNLLGVHEVGLLWCRNLGKIFVSFFLGVCLFVFLLDSFFVLCFLGMLVVVLFAMFVVFVGL
jgi:hypothetical protein